PYTTLFRSVDEERTAVEQRPQASGQLLVETLEVVGAHLVHRDEHDERRAWRRRRPLRHGTCRNQRKRQRDQERAESHEMGGMGGAMGVGCAVAAVGCGWA